MSVSVSIDIALINNEVYKVTANSIIDAMLRQNWRLEKQGKSRYLPIGDDLFEWAEHKIVENDLREIIKSKEINKEIIGLELYWQDTEIGVSVLVFQDYQVSFSPNINRIKTNISDSLEITDTNWYFEKILLCFCNEPFKVGEVSFKQSW